MTETKLVVDCSTGEQTVVPLTPEELEQRELDLISFQEAETARLAAEADQAALKASAEAKLAELGLTDAEIAALTK
jgi:hypothetical protein